VPAPISDLEKKPGKPKLVVRLRIQIISHIRRKFVPLKNSIRVRIRRMRIQDQALNSNSANNMPIPQIRICRIFGECEFECGFCENSRTSEIDPFAKTCIGSPKLFVCVRVWHAPKCTPLLCMNRGSFDFKNNFAPKERKSEGHPTVGFSAGQQGMVIERERFEVWTPFVPWTMSAYHACDEPSL
jgi:hypothetical protein